VLVEDGQLAAVYINEDGLVATLIVDEDRVLFQANRSWTVDEEGVVSLKGIRGPTRSPVVVHAAK
jgi:hypothetical protein